MKFITLFSFLFLALSSSTNFEEATTTADRKVVYRCTDGSIHIVKEKDPSPCKANQIDVKIIINSVVHPEISRKIDKMNADQLQELEFQLASNLKAIDKTTATVTKDKTKHQKFSSLNKATKTSKSNFSKQDLDQKQYLAIDNCDCGDGMVASCPTSATCKSCCKKVEAVKKSLEDLLK